MTRHSSLLCAARDDRHAKTPPRRAESAPASLEQPSRTNLRSLDPAPFKKKQASIFALLAACRLGRQLQHGRVLAFAEQGELQYRAVWQFERVVVSMRPLEVDLSKTGSAVLGTLERYTRLV